LRVGAASDPRLRPALGFLAVFAARPDAITPGHLERLRAAGVRDEAIRDLAQIAISFCLINRIADALEFKVLAPAQFAQQQPFPLPYR
jgi:alkylhydroperoxidase family enzyme